ncbi:helix-loop-helix DNA-binding domain-containing protein [Cladorrhinum sp. PSN332]|nr:helix-loop-helix DNA-binding domain-containing protein [Cladorrhinum sp. PSN332]
MSTGPSQKMSPGGAEDEEKPRLTDKEKKQNHIASEQKRRQAIREAFDSLTHIVPDIEGQGRSEGIVLKATIEHIREEMRERLRIIAELDAHGISVPAELRHSLQSLPEGFLDAEPASPGGDNSSPGPRVIAKPRGKRRSKSNSPDGPQQQ